jgi:hypothetical protein
MSISIKLGAKYPSVKGIKNCSQNGQCLYKEGIITKMQKIEWDHIKIF